MMMMMMMMIIIIIIIIKNSISAPAKISKKITIAFTAKRAGLRPRILLVQFV